MRKKNTNEQLHTQPQFRLKPVYAAVLLAVAVQTAQGNPMGGTVAAGQASFATTGNTLNVTNTPGTIINWQGFSIGANEITHFAQQSASSSVLNRVISNNPSSILGTLQSNGRVFLINPNGIVFGAGATVDVAGLVASTLNLSNADFLAGRNHFTQVPGAANVSNAGNITAQNGGQIYLIAPNVENTGVITAPNGEILLAAGYSVDLVSTSDPNLIVNITAPAGDATNVGQLIAQSGSLGLFGTVVRNSGIVSADSATLQGGKIVFKASQRVEAGGTISAQGAGGGQISLLADMQSGTVNVTGKLDASAPVSGNGGFIETSAAHVRVTDTAHVTTMAPNGKSGTWLIDPNDFTIAAIGGDITGTLLSTMLVSNSVVISTVAGTNTTTNLYATTLGNGDIFVNDPVSWSANLLTLNAQRNININANLNGSGTASLALQYGQGAVAAGNTSNYYASAPVNLPAGNSFSTKLGSDGATVNYTVITSLGAAGSTTALDLQGMNGNLAGYYALGSNIDATTTNTWNVTAGVAAGFTPVGNSTTNFTGTFDGLGHTISNLTINLPTTNYADMFGATGTGSVIRNVGLVGGSVSGFSYVGGLVGVNNGTVSNSYATGSVSGAADYVGGLVAVNGGTISNSYATGSVSGTGAWFGGLVGANFGTVSNSYATGSVSGGIGSFLVGGLVGQNAGTVSNSYATGSVSGGGGGFWIGGLVGQNAGTVSNSYATGSVSGGSGSYNVGGLVGFNYGSSTVSNSYWDTTTSGQATSAGGTGLATAQMQVASNFTGFNFTTTPGASGNNWVMVDADGTLNNAGGAAGATFPMLASEYATNIVNAHQLQLMAMITTASYTLGANINAVATGNSTDVWGSSTFIPVGNSTTQFTGTFDGLGHTISNLTIIRPTEEYVGLFGNIGTSSFISNVALVGGTVSGNNYVGELVGWNSGTINNSSVTGGTVTGVSDVGGLVGYNDGTISGSYGSGPAAVAVFAITGVGATAINVGGLVGYNNGTISGSYVTDGSGYGISIYSVSSGAGGLVGYNSSSGSITNSYVSGSAGGISVNGTNTVGGLVGNNFGTISSSYVNGGSVYVSGVGSNPSNVGGLVGLNSGSINNSSVMSASVRGGSNVGGLVGNNSGTISGNYGSGATVDSATVVGNLNVGGLVGVNNLGYTITNSYVTGGSVSISCTDCGGIGIVGGLVGLNSGSINNSYVTGGTVSGTYDVGGLVGSNDGTISNSYINNSSAYGGNMLGTSYVGGLVGSNDGTISNSYIDNSNSLGGGNVSGTSYVGGLVGSNGGTISSSYVDNSYAYGGNVSGSYDVGGLVGSNGRTISSSYVDNTNAYGGSVSGTSEVGGLVGYNNYGSIDSSHVSAAKVSGSSDVGGLVGYDHRGTISNSYVGTGTVVSGGNYVGGLLGWDSGEGIIQSNTVTGTTVNGNSYVGGLAGYIGYNNYGYSAGGYSDDNHVVNSFVTGGTVSGGSYVGGLVGWNGSPISNSSVSGSKVTGTSDVGGLVGNNLAAFVSGTGTGIAAVSTHSGGYIINSFVSSGTVTATGSTSAPGPVGGLVGYNLGKIVGSYVDTDTIVSGGNSVGGLVGYNDNTISNSYVSGGTVTGSSNVGGLVGLNQYSIDGSFVDGVTVTGSGSNVGGLVGMNLGGTGGAGQSGTVDNPGAQGATGNAATISNSYVSGGTVSGVSNVGGLVGQSSVGVIGPAGSGAYGGGPGGLGGAATISHSYVSGGSVIATATSGSANAGGLVGNNSGTISNSYASNGSVIGSGASAYNFGGLVGNNSGTISNDYVSGGTVSGNSSVGGLVGYNSDTISNSYVSGGTVIGGSYIGGLVGYNSGSVSNNFWDTGLKSGNLTNGIGYDAAASGGSDIGAVGLDIAGMMTMSNFTNAGWNIASTGDAGTIWRIYEGYTTPLLTSFLKPLTIAADPVSTVYTGTAYGGGLVNPVYTSDGITPVIPVSTHLLGNAYVNAINAGTYARAYYSDQQGYDISYVNGQLTVTAAPLTVTASNLAKAYGVTQTFLGTEFTSSGLQNGETIGSVSLASAGAAAAANVAGGPYAITASAATGGTFNAGNYTITYVGGNLSITARPINVAADAISKVYGDADPALTYTVGGLGLASGDTNATTFTGALTRAPGENVATSPYAISQGNLAANTNYTVTGFTGNFLSITPAPLTVYANALSKILNMPDPLLTYMVAGLKFTDTAATTLTGELSRVAVETVGTYPINQNTLALNTTNFASTNYILKYVSANFTIVVPTIVVPAVIDEIVDITNQRPKTPWYVVYVVVADTSNSKGTDLQSLPMCRP